MYFSVGRENLIRRLRSIFLINFFCDMQMPVFWSSIAEAVSYGEKKPVCARFRVGVWRHPLLPKFGMGSRAGYSVPAEPHGYQVMLNRARVRFHRYCADDDAHSGSVSAVWA